jgi:hypothetical protein
MKTPTKSRVTVYTTAYNSHIFQITPPTWATQAASSDSTSSALMTSARDARRISFAHARDLTRCASPCGPNRKESRFHQRYSSGSTSAPKAFVARVRCLFSYKQEINLKLPSPTRLLSAHPPHPSLCFHRLSPSTALFVSSHSIRMPTQTQTKHTRKTT